MNKVLRHDLTLKTEIKLKGNAINSEGKDIHFEALSNYHPLQGILAANQNIYAISMPVGKTVEYPTKSSNYICTSVKNARRWTVKTRVWKENGRERGLE
jgi:hypothetical protein